MIFAMLMQLDKLQSDSSGGTETDKIMSNLPWGNKRSTD